MWRYTETAVAVMSWTDKSCLLIWRSFAKEFGLRFEPLSGYFLLPFLVFGLLFYVEESQLQVEKGPSHHFSVNTNRILQKSAGPVKTKKSYNKLFF
jgi:hypothetical protein